MFSSIFSEKGNSWTENLKWFRMTFYYHFLDESRKAVLLKKKKKILALCFPAMAQNSWNRLPLTHHLTLDKWFGKWMDLSAKSKSTNMQNKNTTFLRIISIFPFILDILKCHCPACMWNVVIVLCQFMSYSGFTECMICEDWPSMSALPYKEQHCQSVCQFSSQSTVRSSWRSDQQSWMD